MGESLRKENEQFRKHMKRHGFVERRLRRIAEDVEDAIDCLQCANCCKVATVRIIERDVEKISKFLGISQVKFLRDYCEESEEEGVILKRTDEEGCVFLNGTECSIYEQRPRNCEYFPHLVRGEGSLESRMWDMKDRAVYCPIVFNTLEAWKKDTGFER